MRDRSWRARRALRGAPVLLAIALRVASVFAQTTPPSERPADAPAAWKELIGEYGGPGKESLTVYENGGTLELALPGGATLQATRVSRETLRTTGDGHSQGHQGKILRVGGKITAIEIGDQRFLRRDLPSGDQVTLLVKPVRPVEELRQEALAATPPHEEGVFRRPDLVELRTLDAAIHLDIRYAMANDFLGTPVYTEARAFLERPAAEALVLALHKVQPLGYGLLIHDGYRPWYVTKIFWDATPPEGKIFVADPAQGSRHNRGSAVDLTLYDSKTGKAVEMPGTYDEMSPRSFANYIGGTSLERWHRDLLRRTMESEGFLVYEYEWWHFDYKDWREYPILNIPFEKLGGPGSSAHVH